jgi:hypothetical protein
LEEVRNWVLIGGGEGGDELESGILALMRYDVADSKKGPWAVLESIVHGVLWNLKRRTGLKLFPSSNPNSNE